MPKTTLYLNQEVVVRLQAIAKYIGFIARRGPSAPSQGGSASQLIEAVSRLSPDKWDELGRLLQ